MTLKERIENNPVAWLLGTLLIGFLAGISCYQAILTISQLDVVRKDGYIKKEVIQELQTSLDTLNSNLTNDCTPIFIDDENSSWEYISSTDIKFSYRFINSTSNKMSCIVNFKTGYCSSGGTDCDTDSENWTKKEEKPYAFIIEPWRCHTLVGQMTIFPNTVSEDALLTYKVIKTDVIK